MPEIAEVARTVHYIHRNLVGKTLAKVVAQDDANVFGKVGTSGAEFQKALTGRKVMDAGQQGKYFWMIMDKPPHPVMHFGMSGWLKYKHEHTYYYQPEDGEEKEEWPPKWWKFRFETKEEPAVEAAFVDKRRFARIRLVDCEAADIRKVSPLVENGPDPVIDKDIVTVEWLTKKCNAKKVPIKAMLLDQANISGIGNWVGDEIMYNAKMHPEQYANTLSEEQITQLHKSIHYVCGTSVDLLADSDKFPEDWLFKHRWVKGKKNASMVLPNGEKIAFLTVGGRTSAVIPSIQKKTGPVAKEMDDADMPDEEEEEKPKKKPKKKASKTDTDAAEEPEINGATEPEAKSGKKRKSATKADDEDRPVVNGTTKKSKVKEELEEDKTAKNIPPANSSKKRKSATSQTTSPSTKQGKAEDASAKSMSSKQNRTKDASGGTSSRRSGRLSKR